MRKLLIVCMTMVALLITGCGSSGSSSSPESAVKDFYKALSSGDMKKLEECTTQQAYLFFKSVATMMSAEEKANLEYGIEVVKVHKTGEHTARVILKDRFGERLMEQVVEIDGKWKVIK